MTCLVDLDAFGLASRLSRASYRLAGYQCRVRGSRASRSPSPIRLIDSTVIVIAKTGRVESHQSELLPLFVSCIFGDQQIHWIAGESHHE